MNKIIKISLVVSLLSGVAHAFDTKESKDRQVSVRKAIDSFGQVKQKEVSTVDKFKQMFSDGKIIGQLRSTYIGYDQKAIAEKDTYATAIGGMLKYELASLNGFNAAFAFTTSQDVHFATGDRATGKQNNELSSSSGKYTDLTEAYINYKNDGFNFRAGRQTLDTPLVDSDDIRMIQNTFEAYLATYELSNFTITAGFVDRWQGVDAGLDTSWIDAGEDGTWLGGISYSSDLEFSAWYYDLSKSADATKATYIDLGLSHDFNSDVSVHGAVQYLNEREAYNSGVEAVVHGGLVELVAYGVGLNAAYNKTNRIAGKRALSGLGGGTLFTSMDTLILNDIADDRDVTAIVLGVVYGIGNWNFLYANGDFDGGANGSGVKARLAEQDMGFEYSVNEEFTLAAIYSIHEDKQSSAKTADDWNRAQVMVKYDF